MYFSKSRRRKRSLKVFNLIQYANSQQQQQPQQQQLFRSCLHLSRRNRCEVAGRRASLSTTLTRTRQEVLVQAQAQAADTLSATNIVDAWWIHRDKAEGATQSTHSVIATQKLTARCSLLRTIEELWALCQR